MSFLPAPPSRCPGKASVLIPTKLPILVVGLLQMRMRITYMPYASSTSVYETIFSHKRSSIQMTENFRFPFRTLQLQDITLKVTNVSRLYGISISHTHVHCNKTLLLNVTRPCDTLVQHTHSTFWYTRNPSIPNMRIKVELHSLRS